MPDETICDFCAEPNPAHSIECAPFIMWSGSGLEHWSDNAWAVCSTCFDLIQANQWERVIDRAIRSYPAKLTQAESSAYRAMLRVTYERFCTARGQTA